MPKPTTKITAARLRELFRYDPDTGIFTRRIGVSGKNGRAGSIAGSKAEKAVVMMIDGEMHLAHRLAWLYVHGELSEVPVTHRNGDSYDNRMVNLQLGSWREIHKATRGPLTHGRLRDVLSYDPASGIFTWLVDRNGGQYPKGSRAGTTHDRLGYRVIGLDGRYYKEHRLAWFYMTGEWPEIHIDHKNGNPADNRFDNLRPAMRGQNIANSKLSRRNQIGLKGVFRTGKRFGARKNIGGKIINLGTFDTAEEAHEAYCKKAVETHGEFARFK